MQTTILLVDDHQIFRKGLRLILEEQEDIRIVGEAGDGQEAIDMARTFSPDMVIMDINMPKLSGIDGTRQIVSEFPSAKVLALSMHSEKRFVEDMLKAGASGYILKESVPEDLLNGIRTVLEGEVYLSPAITGIVVSKYIELLSQPPPRAQERNASPILLTKMYRPPLPADFVARSELVARLDEMLRRPVTLVSSAAGYGKSTLASLWLEAWDGPYAWLSLGKEENDFHMFLNYLLAAIRNAFPGACDTTQSLLQAQRLHSVPDLARYLLNDLDMIEEPFILVLDDYHEIRDKTVNDLMADFLNYPPKNLHLMLLTRRDPSLLTSTLRGRGQVNEIGISDLQFTAAETAVFLKNVLGFSVDGKTAAVIQKKLEGWPAGMRLMSQSLKYSNDLDHLMAGLKGGFSTIVDYLMAEILSQQSSEMARLMTETAILNRFCAPLCDVLGGTDAQPGSDGIDGAEFIAKLQKNNLFLIALDTENRWFRYHHLFQDLLERQMKRRCGSEEIAALRFRASEWFESQGLNEEAIEQALAAGDALAAAKIIERNRRAALDADRWPVLQRWLNRLPTEIQLARPSLQLAQAWILLFSARVGEVLPIIEHVESLLDKNVDDPVLLSEINFFRGLVCYFRGEGAPSAELFTKATELLPENTFLSLKSEAEYWTCVALHLAGRKKTAIRRLHQGIRNRDLKDGMLLSRLSFGLCFIHMLDGECLQAFQEGLRLEKVGRSNRSDFIETWAMYVQGNASFQVFDLDAAQHHLSRVVENRHIANPRATVDALAGLSITSQIMGNPDEANETMSLAREYVQWTKDPVHLDIVRSCQARLELLRGDLDSASRWQRSLRETPGIPMMLFFLEIPVITECRVLIAIGSEASLKGAMENLEDICQNTKAWHNTCQMLDITVLQALVRYRQGRLEEALKALKRAVAMAMPGGSIRPFVEPGLPMADLLKKLAEKNVAVDFIEKLLAAFSSLRFEAESRLEIRDSKSKTQNSLVDHLTNRELDVLELLARRYQNKEIAKKLFISPGTVKGHLKNIFQKLNAGSRRQAVEIAKTLGILSS